MKKLFILLLPVALLSCSSRYQLEYVNQFYKTKNKLESAQGFTCNINSKISLDSGVYIITSPGSNRGNDRIHIKWVNSYSINLIADIDPKGVYLEPGILKQFKQSEINLIISNSFDLLKQDCQKDYNLHIKNLESIRSHISKLKT